ncbi:Galactose-binding-like domain superfamily [Forsythia ovata]|uniref:Galactose-binding-like domain superfamily n=1 Tax=Forsythia ovata TaxID=205694 RepID=A0ABD1V041_9LAMI
MHENELKCRMLLDNYWGGLDPYRTAEDVAFAIARFDQNGGSLLNFYMTTFKAPLGEDPDALDMQSLGKGLAWVNDNSIGRDAGRNVNNETKLKINSLIPMNTE